MERGKRNIPAAVNLKINQILQDESDSQQTIARAVMALAIERWLRSS
jgi:hypothetical protein